MLGTLPGDQARRITYAISLTGNIPPHAVDQIGSSLAAQIANKPEKAFEDTPVKRLGSILNVSAANIRDTLLSGLEEDDQTIGTQVIPLARKADSLYGFQFCRNLNLCVHLAWRNRWDEL